MVIEIGTKDYVVSLKDEKLKIFDSENGKLCFSFPSLLACRRKIVKVFD
jgi:hypothetical protein